MRVLIFLFLTFFVTPSVIHADNCLCGTDEDWRIPVFAEDPFVEPGLDFISGVHVMDVTISPDGDCVIHSSFPDAPPEAENYLDPHSGMLVAKSQ